MQDCYERYRLSDYADTKDAILHSIVEQINYKVPFHNHSYYEIFLVFSGSILHEVNGKAMTVQCCSVLLIRPGDTHRYRQNDGENCGLIRLWVSSQIMDSLVDFLGDSSGASGLLSSSLPPAVIVGRQEMQEYLDRFEAIFSLAQEEEKRRVASLKQLLVELLLLLTGVLSSLPDIDMPLWLDKLCRQMSLKENFVAGVESLFKLPDLSREHISRSFRKYLQTTPTEYINRLRLNYAANQLASTNKKIVEVCYDSGFGNLSYFYDCFKKAYRTSPGDYRLKKMSQYYSVNNSV